MATFHNNGVIFETTEKLHGKQSMGFYFVLITLFLITELVREGHVSEGILSVTESGKGNKVKLSQQQTVEVHRVLRV
jgi:hypothetical protein